MVQAQGPAKNTLTPMPRSAAQPQLPKPDAAHPAKHLAPHSSNLASGLVTRRQAHRNRSLSSQPVLHPPTTRTTFPHHRTRTRFHPIGLSADIAATRPARQHPCGALRYLIITEGLPRISSRLQAASIQLPRIRQRQRTARIQLGPRGLRGVQHGGEMNRFPLVKSQTVWFVSLIFSAGRQPTTNPRGAPSFGFVFPPLSSWLAPVPAGQRVPGPPCNQFAADATVAWSSLRVCLRCRLPPRHEFVVTRDGHPARHRSASR